MTGNLSYDALLAQYNAGYPKVVIDQIEYLFNQNPAQLAINILPLFGKALNLSCNYSKAKEVAHYVLTMNSASEEDSLLALDVLATAELRQGHYEEAQLHAQELVTRGTKVAPRFILAGQMRLAQVKSYVGSPDAAAHELQAILERYKQDLPAESIALAYATIGTFYTRAGMQHQAIEAYKQAVEFASEAGIVSAQITSLHNLGVAYFALGDLDNAYNYFVKTRTICQNKTLNTYIMCSISLGSIYLSYGEPEKAMNLYLEALEQAIIAKHKLYEAKARIEIASVALILADYSRVTQEFPLLEQLTNELNNRDLNLELKDLQTNLQAKLGNFTEAIHIKEEIIAIEETNHLTQSIIRDLVSLLDLYLEINHFDPAAGLLVKINQYIIEQKNPEAKKWAYYAEACIELRKGNLGQAQNLLQLFVEKVDNKQFHRYQSRGYLLLAQISLLTTNQPWKDSKASFENALINARLAAALSNETKEIFTYLDALLVQATIEMAQNNLKAALETLELSKTVASERQIKNYLHVIENRIDEYQEILRCEDSQMAVLLKRQGPRSAIMGLSAVLSIADLTMKHEFMFSNVICYRMGKTGPEVFYSEHPIDELTAVCSGAFLYTAIGQGSKYREGLFGPLPFGEKEAILVFSYRAKDSRPPDHRFYIDGQGFNLLLVGLACDPDKAHLIDRLALQKIINQKLTTISDLSSVTRTEMQDIAIAVHILQ